MENTALAKVLEKRMALWDRLVDAFKVFEMTLPDKFARGEFQDKVAGQALIPMTPKIRRLVNEVIVKQGYRRVANEGKHYYRKIDK